MIDRFFEDLELYTNVKNQSRGSREQRLSLTAPLHKAGIY